MKMQTMLSQYLTVTDGKAVLDECCKKLKVYTIWVCTNPPRKRCHGLSKYEITEHIVAGAYREPVSHYDLMTVIMIYLGKSRDCATSSLEDQIIDLLTLLLSTELDAAYKRDSLEKRYGITPTEEFEKEMTQMCNYSDYVEQIGIKKGIKKGVRKGMEKGVRKGMEKGVQRGLIEACKDLGVSRDITLSKLIAKFSLTQAAAEELLSKYW